MTTLDRYFLQRCTVAVVKALFALVFVYILVDFLAGRQIEIRKHDVPFVAIIRYYAAFLPQIIGRVAPFAVLVSVLLVFGDAAQNNEVTAALAAGISLRRLTLVPMLAALGFSGLLFCLQESAGVAAARELSRIESNYFSRTNIKGRAGVSWARLGEGDWTCHIRKFNRAALTGEGVLMRSIRDDALELIEARRIFWDDAQGKWLLEDGQWNVFSPDSSQRVEPTRRITQTAAPIRETPAELFAANEAPETKQPWALADDIHRASDRGAPTGALWVDYYTKFSQPAVSFIMVWLAIPFALRIRRGGLAISFGTSIGIAVAFLLVFLVCVTLGKVDRIPPFAAAWLANALFMAAGLVLYYRTPT
jgi:lipopolysaccharide export system permease protein